MTPLLIPTRNRPTALSNVLRYLSRFHDSTQVIVADGSNDTCKDHNRQTVEALKHDLAIDYRPYPVDLPLFDRLLDVLNGERSEFIIMGSDDDYPMMDTLAEAEAFLVEHKDYCVAAGMLVSLILDSPTKLKAHLFLARPIVSEFPHIRARDFSQWSFQTTYAVAKRDVLIGRYKRASKLFLTGFHDYSAGIHDCMHGKIQALPKIGFIRTKNYAHSYLKPEDDLSFLRHSDGVLRIVDQMTEDLLQEGGFNPAGARRLSEALIAHRIAELVGRPIHKTEGFEFKPIYLNRTVQKQFEIFDSLFESDTPVRRKYKEKLAFILSALKANARSDDNKGEQKTNETLESQAAQTLVASLASERAKAE